MTTTAQREARCTCGKITLSSPDLTWFQDLGPTSTNATEGCICGLNRSVHDDLEARKLPHVASRLANCGGVFQPRGAMRYDMFFCGHGD